ncbi:VPLPA-CTERM sorting domain-containing protein [Methylobacter sp. S3L5C]|uniref:VPLPA-CTERM sorting domain-containing protein n=1 Tax=Methylobacter sp. S3L5C TaxID=2839024 RepID=UPI001FAC10FB|nr:VPLPA-CTERM sorting domain-containing protein [Methylobacter sp. S3L5C]UOA10533.1 VPLPA-CTERM sorting domain-containing protein [Methylobacter sp. S3L5C]
MKKFNKTLLVAALMIAAGSANANISVHNGDSELFMSVYDSSSKNTYSLNTGLTIDAFIAAASNSTYAYTHDLSLDAVWTSGFKGAAGFNAATTSYALIVGSNVNPDVLLTSSAVGGLVLTDTIDALVSNFQIQAGEVNASGFDISKVVNDGSIANTGQFKDFDNAFGLQTGAKAAGAYGSALAFFHATNVPNAAGDELESHVEQFAGSWTLAGNTLSFSAPAPISAVPLPAAVWFFGAGLMGMLRLNRRK